jgi:hypothetical protein
MVAALLKVIEDALAGGATAPEVARDTRTDGRASRFALM